MSELDQPILLTFKNADDAHTFVLELERALEETVWETRKTEDGTVIVSILSITNLEEKQELEDEEDARD